jgi:hypothetical protein
MAKAGRTDEIGETTEDSGMKDFDSPGVEGKKEIPPGPPLRKGGENQDMRKGGIVAAGEVVTGQQVIDSLRKKGVRI